MGGVGEQTFWCHEFMKLCGLMGMNPTFAVMLEAALFKRCKNGLNTSPLMELLPWQIGVENGREEPYV